MLSEHQVIAHLIHRGLLEAGSIVDGTVTVLDASRRHTNFCVVADGGPSFLVKQASDAEKARALDHEARLYRMLQSPEAGSRFPAFLPGFRDYDPEGHVLVIDLLNEAEDMRRYQTRRRRVSTSLANLQGRMLARLHARPIRDSRGALVLPEIKPWIFSVEHPHVTVAQNASPAGLQCLKLIQRFAGEAGLLEPVTRMWEPNALIHGDARLDNWLTVPARRGGTRGLRLVDWELASAGDRCWDIAAVLSDYLATWVLSIPGAVEMDAQRLLSMVRFPLERLQPGIAAFWRSYSQTAKLGREAAPTLGKSVQFTALRLVQNAFEISQGQPQLAASVVCVLQVAVNILERPEDAAAHLLGIWPGDESF